MLTALAKTMITKVKIAHIVSIITFVRSKTFARKVNIVRKPRVVIIIEIVFIVVVVIILVPWIAPFVNPIESIWIDASSTMVDAIIEASKGDKTGCLTIFG